MVYTFRAKDLLEFIDKFQNVGTRNRLTICNKYLFIYIYFFFPSKVIICCAR